MTEDSSLHSAETLVAPVSRWPWWRKLTKLSSSKWSPREFSWAWLGHSLVLTSAAVAGVVSSQNIGWVQTLDRQVQTAFFSLRGQVTPPQDIVILALDQSSLDQGNQVYASDPKKYAYLSPLATSPPRRTAYAVAIQRLMEAGARVVAIDIVFDAPSSQPEDDRQFQTALAQHSSKVVLAAMYGTSQTDSGDLLQLIQPNPKFQDPPVKVGYINYPLDPQTRAIHLLGSQYPILEATTYSPEKAQEFLRLSQTFPSFSQAIVQAVGYPPKPPRGSHINFYGPEGTFTQIPFWQVLDPESWARHQENKTFHNRIVLIGPTASIFNDSHRTPFGLMPGVEIHANSVATLIHNRAIATAITNLPLQGFAVGLVVLAAASLQSRWRRPMRQLAGTIGLSTLWGSVGYIAFTTSQLFLPVSIPMLAIVTSGASYLVVDSLQRRAIGRRQESDTIEQTTEIDRPLSGRSEPGTLNQGTVLAGRYEIVHAIGAGGFGKTYKARDTQRPGQPLCVVKQLRLSSNTTPKHLEYAQASFQREAQVLEALGKHHPQIPELLANFSENGEFYLVQEFIEGIALQRELGRSGQTLSERQVISILNDLLPVLDFIHRHKVIHRDIKPSNLIRRSSDKKLVLIDFGAVKTASRYADDISGETRTVAIGTPGYIPKEQVRGKPRYNSDIYALGMVAIEALTGLSPRKLESDPETENLLWQQHASHVSKALADVLNQMIQEEADQRYSSAADILAVLSHPPFSQDRLIPPSSIDDLSPPELTLFDEEEEEDTATRPWPTAFSQDGSESSTTQPPLSAHPTDLPTVDAALPPTDIPSTGEPELADPSQTPTEPWTDDKPIDDEPTQA